MYRRIRRSLPSRPRSGHVSVRIWQHDVQSLAHQLEGIALTQCDDTAVDVDAGFAAPLRGRGCKGDLLVAISSPTRSPNILAAVDVASELEIAVVPRPHIPQPSTGGWTSFNSRTVISHDCP